MLAVDTVTTISSSDGVRALATGLLDARRDRPWCVVSVPAGAADPLFDVAELVDEIGDVCRLYVIDTGTLSRELDALLPALCQVYGGAARVYPIGGDWTTTPALSPLRFWHNPSSTDKLVADALAMANAAGLFEAEPSASVRAEGVVKSLLAGGTRALVALDSGDYATVLHELTFPLIPLDWVLEVGQRVAGRLDGQTRRLVVDAPVHDAASLLALYPPGSVTLALVSSVERQKATLAVHPSVPIEVARKDVSSNPYDRVDLLLDEGDVVRVRVVRDEQGRTRLRLSDVDDEETVQPAVSLLAGGEPWLHPERHVKVAEEEHPQVDVAVLPGVPTPISELESPASPLAVPGPGPRPATGPIGTDPIEDVLPAENVDRRAALQTALLTLDQERSRANDYERQLIASRGATEVAAALRLELGEVIREVNDLREKLQKTKADQQQQRTLLRRARQGSAGVESADRRGRFVDSVSWIRHELYLAWIDRLDAGDRQRWPLPDVYTVGARFIESVDGLDDQYLAKALKACVDVLTGMARELPARKPHPLRQGTGASEADVVRADGARCMRVYIEQGTASARRLHYWVLPDGAIELSRVVLHDDMEP